MTAKRRHMAEQHDSSKRALVLLSGGIDSSTCVAFYREHGFQVDALFVDFGQPGATLERDAAAAICGHYCVELHEAEVRGIDVAKKGFVAGRNALLISAALSATAPASGLVALGIHAGVPYPDCTRGFVTACQALADIYHDGAVQIAAPFVEWGKDDIATAAKDLQVPLRKTYSCEAGIANGCGACSSCLDRARIL